MIITNNNDRKELHLAGKQLRAVLDAVAEKLIPGADVKELDTFAHDYINKSGYTPSFLNYTPGGMTHAFPATLCVSINDQLVHGIPGGRESTLKEGDIVTIDCGLMKDGKYFVDAAKTVIVGDTDEVGKKLVEAARQALQSALVQARAGNTVGDIGYVIESVAREEKFSIPPELGGHGVGAAVHEEPFIPNLGDPGTGDKLVEGQVVAIEPILIEGDDPRIELDVDNFAYKTVDGSRAAHFEHTIIITKGAPEVVTGPMW